MSSRLHDKFKSVFQTHQGRGNILFNIINNIPLAVLAMMIIIRCPILIDVKMKLIKFHTSHTNDPLCNKKKKRKEISVSVRNLKRTQLVLGIKSVTKILNRYSYTARLYIIYHIIYTRLVNTYMQQVCLKIHFKNG